MCAGVGAGGGDVIPDGGNSRCNGLGENEVWPLQGKFVAAEDRAGEKEASHELGQRAEKSRSRNGFRKDLVLSLADVAQTCFLCVWLFALLPSFWFHSHSVFLLMASRYFCS